uniref:ATPase AAA-type core domain-containing protein n=1 Tax=Panagrolaimus sp. PS1159 TaxID=55785 RepID=A0AC35FKV5_9BILA
MRIFEWFTKSMKDVIDYYEEDVYEPLAEFFEKHEIYNVLVIGLIFTIIYLPCLLISNGTEPWHISEANSTKRHLTQLDLIEYFPTNHKLRSVFNLLNNRIEFPPPTPLAIVLAGSNVAKEELKFKEISTKHFWMENITILANRSISEAKLFSQISEELEKFDGKAFVFIEEIDKLPGRSPLVLQSLSDVDASKYKETVYILTVVDDVIDKSMDEKECTEMITRKLEKAWSASLHIDQINPIISRITGITICL